MKKSKLQTHLETLVACEGAKEWSKELTAKVTWEKCSRPDWLLWWAARTTKNSKQSIVRVAAQCARLSLKYVPEGEDRPRLAIESAEKWAENPTQENAKAAADAARAAAYAAYAADAAAYAARAAAYAAYAADAADAYAADAYAADAYAADAARAAAYAAYAADAYAAYAAVTKECCDICRRELVLPWSEENEI
jgi:hypothetical protein